MATKLIDPNGGSTVSVDDSRVEALLAVGYTRQSSSSKSTGSKSGSSSSKSSSK